jgi:hypothetical protein
MQERPSDGGTSTGVTTPPAGPRVVVERPPPGLARGKYAFPAWGIGILGSVIVLLGLVYVGWRIRQRKQR